MQDASGLNRELNDATGARQYQMDMRNTAVTLVVLALVIPESILFLSHLFSNQPRPTKNTFLMSLIVGTLETFGHCVLVFKVLPSIDVVRGVLLLSCIGVLPGIAQLVFGQKYANGRVCSRRKVFLAIAVALQVTSLLAVVMFSFGWKEAGISTLRPNSSLNVFTREPAHWTIDSVNQLSMNWVVVAIFLTNLTWCGNFIGENLCGRKLPNAECLKSLLEEVKQKPTKHVPLSKILFTFVFVFSLVPDLKLQIKHFDFQIMEVTQESLTQFKLSTTYKGEKLIDGIRDSIIRDVQQLGGSGHREMSDAIMKQMSTIIVVGNQGDELIRHPKHYLSIVTDPENNIAQALKQMYINEIETGDKYRNYAMETLDALQGVKKFSRDTRVLFQDYSDFLNSLKKPNNNMLKKIEGVAGVSVYFIALLVFSVSCSFLAKLACKLNMQLAGFSLPLLFSTPCTVILLYLQCTRSFMPGTTKWMCMESDRSSGILYLTLGLGVLWWISQMVVVSHIWYPGQNWLAPFDKLFTVSTCGFSMTLTEQYLLYNRRRGLTEMESFPLGGCLSLKNIIHGSPYRSEPPDSKVISIATVQHKNTNKMTQLLSSVVQVANDQREKKATKKEGTKDCKYQQFEVHVMINEALEFNDEKERFTATLCEAINQAASLVCNTVAPNPPPTCIPVPYGIQLRWTLLGGTVLTVHLKDRDKIQNNQWTQQVMYTHYLLGYKTLCETDDSATMKMLRGGHGQHIGQPSHALTEILISIHLKLYLSIISILLFYGKTLTVAAYF